VRRHRYLVMVALWTVFGVCDSPRPSASTAEGAEGQAERVPSRALPQDRLDQMADVEPVGVEIHRSDYFAMYPIRNQADAAHPIEVTAHDGTTWYRQAVPLLDLSELRYWKTFVNPTEDGYEIFLFVKRSEHADFRSWTLTHRGSRLGVLIDGELIWAPEVDAPFGGAPLRFVLSNSEKAYQVAEGIRSGGVSSGPTTHLNPPSMAPAAPLPSSQPARKIQSIVADEFVLVAPGGEQFAKLSRVSGLPANLQRELARTAGTALSQNKDSGGALFELGAPIGARLLLSSAKDGHVSARLLDDRYRCRVSLSAGGNGVSEIALLGEEGTEQAVLGLQPDGTVSLSFLDRRPPETPPSLRAVLTASSNGMTVLKLVGENVHSSAELGTSPDGSSWLTLVDNHERARAVMSLDPSGSPSLKFYAEDGQLIWSAP